MNNVIELLPSLLPQLPPISLLLAQSNIFKQASIHIFSFKRHKIDLESSTGESEVASVSFTDRLSIFKRSQLTLCLPVSVSQYYACAGPIISQCKLAVFTQQKYYLPIYRLDSETIHFP